MRRPAKWPFRPTTPCRSSAAASALKESRRRAPPAPPALDSDDEAVVSGTLRSPWKWEELIVESAVVGGRTRLDGKARWRRRLDGLKADYEYRIQQLAREEPESPRMGRYARDLRNLSHLRQFALPIVDRLAEWPERATWGEWLDRFGAMARRMRAATAPAGAQDTGGSAADGGDRSRLPWKRRATSSTIG